VKCWTCGHAAFYEDDIGRPACVLHYQGHGGNEDLGAEERRAAARDDREGWTAEADSLAARRRAGL
jgi:hypothetical protein